MGGGDFYFFAIFSAKYFLLLSAPHFKKSDKMANPSLIKQPPF